jgi:hypothetical protein
LWQTRCLQAFQHRYQCRGIKSLAAGI